MKSIREQLLLYAVTDRSWTGRKSLYEQVECALKGGVTMVQLREKEQDDDAFLEEAIQMTRLQMLLALYAIPDVLHVVAMAIVQLAADLRVAQSSFQLQLDRKLRLPLSPRTRVRPQLSDLLV